MSYIRRHGKRRWRDSGAIAWQPCRALSPINKPYVLRKHLGVTYLLDMHLAFVDHRHEGEEESLRSLTSRAHTSLFLPFAIAELTDAERRFRVSFGNLPTIYTLIASRLAIYKFPFRSNAGGALRGNTASKPTLCAAILCYSHMIRRDDKLKP